jgi:ADP-heptose:LPS heptosyltransferase
MSFNENLVIRMGGLGDLVILSSSLHALKKREPWRPLVLATLAHNVDLLAGVDCLDRVITMEEWEQEQWFRVYDCRWGVEPPNIGPGRSTWEEYQTKDRSDIFDRILGVQSEKQFSVSMDAVALKEMKGILRSSPPECRKGPLIGLAPTSRSPVRCMPPEYVHPLADLLLQTFGGQVVLFGKTESWNKMVAAIVGPGINNLIDLLSIQEMVALTSLMDVVISPDTAVYHIAAALGRSCLALFGNIHPNTRTTYYPTVKSLYPAFFGLEKELTCASNFPCWDVPNSCNGIKPGEFGAPCMRLLTPERIVSGLENMNV